MSARIRLHRIEGEPVTLHFSPGYRERASRLGALVAEAHVFLAEWLEVEAHTTLSVLRGESWRRLRRAPYGYPHSNPQQATIFAPAHYPPRFIERARDLYEAAPAALQRGLCEDGSNLPEQIRTFYDLVAVHELGHLFIHHLRLELGTFWLTELVANLFAIAFFLERRPELAACWLAWAEIQGSLEVPHRSLSDYDRYYRTLNFANGNYYQGQLNKQAARLWHRHGRAIAPRLIEQFSVTPEIVAERFRTIAPDFNWEAGEG